MRIVILTSAKQGTASYMLPILVENGVNVVGVLYSKQIRKSGASYIKKKWSKLLRIGLLGALNGIRMRRWYGKGVENYAPSKDISLLCRELGVRFFEIDSFYTTEVAAVLHELAADLGISLGNGYIPSRVFSTPRLGMINIHGEELPEYKNAQSVIWQLYNGSCHTGFTIHEINKEIDGGRILMTRKIPLQFRPSLADTVSYNCSEILKHATDGLVEVVNNFESFCENAKAQGSGRSYTTPTIFQFIRILKNYRKLKR